MNKSKPQTTFNLDRTRSQTAHESQNKGSELNWNQIKKKFFQPEVYQENLAVLYDDDDNKTDTLPQIMEENKVNFPQQATNNEFDEVSLNNEENADKTPKQKINLILTPKKNLQSATRIPHNVLNRNYKYLRMIKIIIAILKGLLLYILPIRDGIPPYLEVKKTYVRNTRNLL